MYSKRVVIPTTDNDKDIIHTYNMNRYFILNKLQLALYTRLQQLLLDILQNVVCFLLDGWVVEVVNASSASRLSPLSSFVTPMNCTVPEESPYPTKSAAVEMLRRRGAMSSACPLAYGVLPETCMSAPLKTLDVYVTQ